ncbi:MAG: response regulator [Candidatus Sericytochromatia bacterium]|nr:response regulator [Candidatus Sericytochromatia bacterium]
MDVQDDSLNAITEQFITGLSARLARIERALASLAMRPAEPPVLRALLRECHDLAGTGGAFGFTSITTWSRQAEQRARRLLDDGLAPSEADLRDWRSLLALLVAERERIASDTNRRTETIVTVHDEVNVSGVVLIVDSDPHTHHALTQRLHDKGLVAVKAANLADALAIVEVRLPAGIITDVTLTDGSGYELARHVRKMPGGHSTAILVVSAGNAFLDKVEAIHSGSDGYFVKPVDWDVVGERLGQLLERQVRTTARILSVEDDPDQAMIIRTYLESAGYQVQICRDPQTFEAAISTFQPDLVLLDVSLPGLDGYTLARYLRQDERHTTLPIIFLTGHSQMSDKVESLRAGGNDFLVKPISPAILVATVAAHLERAALLKGLLDRDGLTRLLTHTAFWQRAKAVVARQHRHTMSSAALAMIDLDHFKSVNDRFGHPTGDRVLVSLATMLRQSLRPSDVIGRYGGEEFALLIDDLRLEEAERLVNRLLSDFAAVAHPAPDGSTFHVTFSGGVAMFDPHEDVDVWKERADKALYQAKRAGRRQVVVHSKTDAPETVARGESAT